MTQTAKIAFIGAGNMASAIFEGLIANGYPVDQIWVTDRSEEKLAPYAARGLKATTDNDEALAACDIAVLAVKPQVMKTVVEAHRDAIQQYKPLLVSVAAGIDAESLSNWAGDDVAIVRCMPNTPALVQTGASGLYANALVSEQQRQQTEEILAAVGITLWVENEAQIDAVTAVSGSGPAYYFLFMEAMAKAGEQLGLDAETALKLTLQTALGAARMSTQSDLAPAELRRNVTSPKGTTEQAILSFQQQGIDEMVLKAMTACRDRAEALTEELCKD
ncbi:pyrroline-5-carboxylate reductase [Marinobacterium mangrovicola]|uniref:Pyrroline-5-carboxylate reductase n=1 Tax=Marinobacterium mangrovicola TaxID=1476959 RepID=A0A4R1H4C3_9GAMM|nr:pyrroline-5-carboxylate reductase [Marinobacterium mangrovicola]TCK16517.1 pyrroline-5-carboxylate reductase [Marinobacterium mangrovicola]